VGLGTVEKRLRDGRYRDHASASCSNGHEWWSVHPEAIRQAHDANALAALCLATARALTSPSAG
jgi:exosome complex RNA-binding protein Rrp42 (RNase PH superfamily)